jgi:inner membrane protein
MDNLITHFAQNHDHFLYAVAGLCLLLELSVLGMSGPLLFIALSCVATGILVSLTLVTSWQMELLTVGVLTVFSALALWRPLKNFQNSGGGPDLSSDMIGKHLPVTHEITQEQGRVAYSGIEWQARLEENTANPIATGQRAEVVGVDGSILLVKLFQNNNKTA